MGLIDNYAAYEYVLASSQLALAMLGMGALLSIDDFAAVLANPRGLGVGLSTQLLLVPLAAALLCRWLPVDAGLAVGMVLVAAVPGGTLSNLVTLLGRGNVALSISLTVVTTVVCLLTTPLILRLLAAEQLPPAFSMPAARIAREIALVLLVPLAAGMVAGNCWPAKREAFSRWCIRGSLAVIGLIIVGVAGSGRLDPRAYGPIGPVAVFACAYLFQAVAYAASRAAGISGSERLAVVLEATVRNTNLAILLKASLFPAVTGKPDPVGDGMLFVGLLYGGVALIAAGPPLLWHRRYGQAWTPQGLTPSTR